MLNDARPVLSHPGLLVNGAELLSAVCCYDGEAVELTTGEAALCVGGTDVAVTGGASVAGRVTVCCADLAAACQAIFMVGDGTVCVTLGPDLVLLRSVTETGAVATTEVAARK